VTGFAFRQSTSPSASVTLIISSRLKAVILRELDLEDFEITKMTTADSIPGWDSLSHVRIIVAVEAEYGIRFSTREVLNLKKVGDLQDLVERKAG
jgi:acyl carrier protein